MIELKKSPLHQRGFTLVELMITLLIASILLGIAVAGYGSQIRKSRRTEAKTALLDLAGREEQLYSTTSTYSANLNDVGYGTAQVSTMVVASGYYSVTVAVPNSTTFTLTATPNTADQRKDTNCAVFTVTNTGLQSSTDTSTNDSTATCWR